jgi:ankyrin repeat protein
VANVLLGVDGIQINCQDQRGRTPLHDAAARGNVSLAHCLINHKVPTSVYTFGLLQSYIPRSGNVHDRKAQLKCVDDMVAFVCVGRGF